VHNNYVNISTRTHQLKQISTTTFITLDVFFPDLTLLMLSTVSINCLLISFYVTIIIQIKRRHCQLLHPKHQTHHHRHRLAALSFTLLQKTDHTLSPILAIRASPNTNKKSE
jgi:hypothetical protein